SEDRQTFGAGPEALGIPPELPSYIEKDQQGEDLIGLVTIETGGKEGSGQGEGPDLPFAKAQEQEVKAPELVEQDLDTRHALSGQVLPPEHDDEKGQGQESLAGPRQFPQEEINKRKGRQRQEQKEEEKRMGGRGEDREPSRRLVKD